MNPGTLREIVKILRPSQKQDETGQKVDGWELVKDGVRAEYLASPGVEAVAAGRQTVARVPTQFKIRVPLTFEVNATMRLIWKTKTFQIVGAVDERARRVDMVVTCEELVGEPPWLAST